MFKCDTAEQWLNTKPIGEQQANDIAGMVFEYTDLLDGVKPSVTFDGRQLRTKNGHCWGVGTPRAGEIVLFKGGQNWGTLSHELAHLAPGARRHNWVWYNACLDIRKEMAEFVRRATIVY